MLFRASYDIFFSLLGGGLPKHSNHLLLLRPHGEILEPMRIKKFAQKKSLITTAVKLLAHFGMGRINEVRHQSRLNSRHKSGL